jgi:hypothetical protein
MKEADDRKPANNKEMQTTILQVKNGYEWPA